MANRTATGRRDYSHDQSLEPARSKNFFIGIIDRDLNAAINIERKENTGG